jgi:hypothetical protein
VLLALKFNKTRTTIYAAEIVAEQHLSAACDFFLHLCFSASISGFCTTSIFLIGPENAFEIIRGHHRLEITSIDLNISTI